MISSIVVILIFLTVFLVMFGINMVVTDLFLKERDQQKERLKEQNHEQNRHNGKGFVFKNAEYVARFIAHHAHKGRIQPNRRKDLLP